MKLSAFSIRWKMTLLYTGLLALLLFAFSLFLYFSIERLMVKNLDEMLNTRMKMAQANTGQVIQELAQVSSTAPNGLPYQLSSLEKLAGPGLFFQLSDQQHRVVAASSNLNRHSLPLPQQTPIQPGQVVDGQIRLPVDPLLPDSVPGDLKDTRFELRSFLLVDQTGQAVGLLEGAQSLLSVDQIQDGLIDVLEQGMVVALGLAILAGLWLAGRLLKPIARVTETANQIGSSGDLSRRIVLYEKPRQDEVGRLALTFNTMLEKLETAFKAQRRFVADAGHEFKTPLTAILGHAHFIRRRGKTNPELLEETTRAIIHETERLRRLTLDLLDLAQLDEKPAFQPQKINLAELAGEVVNELLPLAEARNIQLEFHNKTTPDSDAGPVLVEGDQDKLKQVVLNLVDNALNFTPSGGQIRVITHLEEQPGPPKAILEVSDNGRGIEADHLPHIFERFYRAEKSRNRRVGGSGLGLAIVQEIVRQHKGEVSAQSQPGQGSTFRVWLPLNSRKTTSLGIQKL